MMKAYIILIFFTLVFTNIAGCSSRAWYEGLRETERQNCYKKKNSTETLECLNKVNDMSYDQYQKELESSKK